jgi:hypothetical protein
MYYNFRKLIKETGSRGWRLESDNDRFYLSKFEEMFNDNEIRVYISFEETGITIERVERIKSYSKTVEMKIENNKYYNKAKELCDLYWEKYGKTEFASV